MPQPELLKIVKKTPQENIDAMKSETLKILKADLKANFKAHQSSHIDKFIDVFYANSPQDTFARARHEDVLEGISKVWEFFQTKENGKPKIDAFHWKPKEGNAAAERIVINIVDANLSFSLDSLYGLLSRLDTKARLTFHPIFNVKRDKDGTLTHLAGPKEFLEGGQLESIVHCEVVNKASSSLLKDIKDQLPSVLESVRLANQDWKPMRAKALETIEELRILENAPNKPEALDETLKFLEWMESEHFTFLGYCNYDLVPDDVDKLARRVENEDALGILTDPDLSHLQTLFEGIALNEESKKYILNSFPVIINKTSVISKVHRSVRMDSIGVRRYDENGKVIGIRLFVGLFTSVAYDSSARDIPLLRTKIEKIITKAGFTFDWHDGKALIHILDSLPRDELFQASIQELTDIALRILRLKDSKRLAFFVRRDQFNRFLSCLVYIPRDRFDSELCDRIADILREKFDGTIGTYKAQYGELAFARVHYTIHSSMGLKDSYDLEHIEQLLLEESKSWADDLKITLMDRFQEVQSAELYRRYRRAFDKGYQERYKGADTLDDIKAIENLSAVNDFSVRIYGFEEKNSKALKLKIYNKGTPLPLSDVIPIMENLDLKVISEVPYEISPQGCDQSVWIHDFNLESRGGCIIDLEATCKEFEETLVQVRLAHVENDGFNRLVLRAGLNWRQCSIFRAYAKYLRLIGLPFSKAYVANTLVRNPSIVVEFKNYFEARFDPKNQDKEKAQKHHDAIFNKLEGVSNADDDRVLRLYLTVLNATVRTNYYQKNTEGDLKDYLSFKISSRDIEQIPKPRPLFEIFVYASYVEGVHLRCGKIARGGLRWSDRHEDFRTEVLNLVKAQMVKNTVIVPVGSKGGFIVKTSTEGYNREEFLAEGVRCYQTFICGLLDLTDNLVNGKVVHPENVVRYDADDTYLVVAADKGTATFSDYANEISNKYNFWLGDAFASGGSVGYDHKKMGITAKGAWESVKRHFREMGKDIQNEDFTAIGIGDMSGDVFGNGMLLSKHIKLIAAFNHMHIFIDPNPNAAKSFTERKRLFEMPRSSWTDYDKKVLSKGAEIYSRSDKKITLTPEIKDMLGVSHSIMRPDDLIVLILKHNAELLWFGGIGTYIKSSTEGINDIGDRANDNTRIDAKDLRVKVIGEGANLGCTQLGRIEFERLVHGRINTDAIDNSAGVSCSDREVNIKILFNDIMRSKSMHLEERNKILVKMTEEVSELVLRDNYLQPQTITDIASLGNKNFDQQIQLIRRLEQDGILDRSVEYLPDDMGLEELQNSQTYFSRPEFAVVLGYAKINFYDQLLATDVPDDAFFHSRLISYFPTLLHKNYLEQIMRHPLRREIITTFAVNSLVNRMGPSFINLAINSTSSDIANIFKAYFIACEVFKIRQLWDDIEDLDCKLTEEQIISYRLMVYKIVKRTVLWLLRYYPLSDSIDKTTQVLSVGIDSFLSHMQDTLHSTLKSKIEGEINNATTQGMPKSLAHRLSILKIASTSPDIILIANETKKTVPEVAELYFQTDHNFFFSILRETLDSPTFNTTPWERKLVNAMVEDLYSCQSDLVVHMLEEAETEKIKTNDHFESLLSHWKKSKARILNTITNTIKESQLETKPDLTVLGVVLRDVKRFCE